MAQLSKGTTFTTGDVVTATNLNAIVDNAVLLGGAITDQPSAASVATSDKILVNQSGTLKQASVSQVLDNVNVSGLVKADGSVAMTGNLTLPATAPSSTQAVSRAWVEGYVTAGTLGYTPVNKAGDSMSGNLTMTGTSTVVLARNPATNLESAPKQYVDTAVSGLATQAALTSHTGNTSNPHGTTAAQVGLGNVDNTSDLNKPLSTAATNALALKLDKSGGTMTGALALSTTTPSSSTEAAAKGYVDTQDALLVPIAGGVFSNNFLFNGSLQCSTTPSSANDVLNKSYFDTIPRVVAATMFQTNTASNLTTQTLFYLTVVGSRVAGTNTLTIDYSGLGANYKNSAQPFFLAGQYIGIVGVTGITGKLYKIQSPTDFANKKFTVTTTETTAINQNIQLTLVHDCYGTTYSSVSKNIKSIYWNPAAPSKYYINYIADTKTGSKTNESPDLVYTTTVTGNAAEGTATAANACQAMLCYDIVGRTTYIDNVNYIEGYQATTMGCHIAYMRAVSTGAANALWSATVYVTQ